MSDLVTLRRPGEAKVPSQDAAVPVVADPSAQRVYIETYGCQMNVADSEMVLGLLGRGGYVRTESPDNADLILLNTCAIREKAEEKVFARVSALAHHRKRRGAIIGVTGCMAEHLKENIHERAPYVDLVLGPDAYRRLPEHIENLRADRKPTLDTKLDRHETYEGLDPSREMTGGVTGHISIQRGCDKFCTFCVVPYTRGREHGTPPREILRQARAMAEAGYREVQLLGQTVNSYRYEDVTFAELLLAVASIEGLERVRFTSPYPLDFSPEVIAAMASHPKICKHVHLPLQSGSDTVLQRMKRGYDFATFARLADDLRAAMPDIVITTDLMVGFCGETEAEHQDSLAAITRIQFDNAFTFAYSEREGTVAFKKIPDDVPADVKQRRLEDIITLQRKISGERLARQVGKRLRVLVENTSKRSDKEYLARTDGFHSVIIPAGPGVEPGILLDVMITGTTSATLLGHPVES